MKLNIWEATGKGRVVGVDNPMVVVGREADLDLGSSRRVVVEGDTQVRHPQVDIACRGYRRGVQVCTGTVRSHWLSKAELQQLPRLHSAKLPSKISFWLRTNYWFSNICNSYFTWSASRWCTIIRRRLSCWGGATGLIDSWSLTGSHSWRLIGWKYFDIIQTQTISNINAM